MAKVRSPNYPNMSLGPAIEAVRIAFNKDNRNKMSRATLAKHMGYTSLNGRALGKIGAIRAYGLIDGSGDELRISDDAVHALVAPAGSPQRQAALERMAQKPTLFGEIRKQYPDTFPSSDNLRYWLVTQGFTQEAAEKAAKSYLATMNIVSGINDAYNPPDDDEETGDEDDGQTELRGAPPPPPLVHKAKVMTGERELTTGLLSKDTSFRLIVSGTVGVKEIERLIKKLELDKEILASPDNYNPGSWHQIVFFSDMASSEVTRFATTMKRAFDNAKQPDGCEMRRQVDAKGIQTIFLSPAASELAFNLHAYSGLLESIDITQIDQYPSFKDMRIFN